ncbi:hypothetical protein ACFQ9X_42605 [Catenulispora yoronensis]
MAVVITVLNPIVVSSTGLESALAVALITALLAAAVSGRAGAFGAISALLFLTRGDLVVIPAVLALGSRQLWPGKGRMLAAAAAVALPWTAWSWWFLASAVPDTLLIKMDFGGWSKLGHDWFFADGLVLYLRMYPLATTISLLGVAAGLLTLGGFWTGRLRIRLRARPPQGSPAAPASAPSPSWPSPASCTGASTASSAWLPTTGTTRPWSPRSASGRPPSSPPRGPAAARSPPAWRPRSPRRCWSSSRASAPRGRSCRSPPTGACPGSTGRSATRSAAPSARPASAPRGGRDHRVLLRLPDLRLVLRPRADHADDRAGP